MSCGWSRNMGACHESYSVQAMIYLCAYTYLYIWLCKTLNTRNTLYDAPCAKSYILYAIDCALDAGYCVPYAIWCASHLGVWDPQPEPLRVEIMSTDRAVSIGSRRSSAGQTGRRTAARAPVPSDITYIYRCRSLYNYAYIYTYAYAILSICIYIYIYIHTYIM